MPLYSALYLLLAEAFRTFCCWLADVIPLLSTVGWIYVADDGSRFTFCFFRVFPFFPFLRKSKAGLMCWQKSYDAYDDGACMDSRSTQRHCTLFP